MFLHNVIIKSDILTLLIIICYLQSIKLSNRTFKINGNKSTNFLPFSLVSRLLAAYP